MSKSVDINFYSVPNTYKVSGGSRTRIRNVINVLKTDYSSHIIIGNSLDKIKGILKAPKSRVLYVESATNRIKLIDVFCLMILFFKSDKRYIYIRDVYIELFPEEFNTFRKKITLLLNKLTNRFYAYYANTLCFPTKEMADSFYDFHSKFPRKKIFVFPPGIADDYGISTKKEENIFPKLNKKISF